MIYRRVILLGATFVLLVMAVLVVLNSAAPASGSPIVGEILIDQTTLGYYNFIGNKLDGVQPWFPPVLPPDPTLNPAPEPDPEELVFRAGLAALLDDEPMPLGSGWGDLRIIPSSWTPTTESAAIYTIDAGPLGIKNLTGHFGVDNGIYVWVNGHYKFGAMEPGPAIKFEYENIPLDDLGPGINYLQLIREDHGAGTGFHILVTGTRLTGDMVLSAEVENATVSYGGREQHPGQIFFPDACSEGLEPLCSPSIEMRPSPDQPDKSARVTLSCRDAELQNLLIASLTSIILSGLEDEEPVTVDDVVWNIVENGYQLSQSIDERCASTPLNGIAYQSASTTRLVSVWLTEGSYLVDLPEAGARWKTMTPAGSFTPEESGIAAVGYNPDTGKVGVSAFTAPVLVEPVVGNPFTIMPGQKVILTDDSIGPVTELPQVLIPVVVR